MLTRFDFWRTLFGSLGSWKCVSEPAFLQDQEGKKCDFYERGCLPSRDSEILCSWKVCPAPSEVITTHQTAPGDENCYSRSPRHTWISGMCASPTHMDLGHTWILGTHTSLAHVDLWHTWFQAHETLWHTWISGTYGSLAHVDLLGTCGSLG